MPAIWLRNTTLRRDAKLVLQPFWQPGVITLLGRLQDQFVEPGAQLFSQCVQLRLIAGGCPDPIKRMAAGGGEMFKQRNPIHGSLGGGIDLLPYIGVGANRGVGLDVGIGQIHRILVQIGGAVIG